MTRRPKVLLASAAAIALSIGVSPAFAYDVPSSWSESGLKVVVSEVGTYSWSVDGLGTNVGTGTGTVQASKPAGATVHKAYLMAAQIQEGSLPTLGSPSAVLLEGSAVTFELESLDVSTGCGDGPSDPVKCGFNNYFGDVTSIVKPTLDAASAGITSLTIDEGGLPIEGTALLVIWNDPAIDVSTVVIAFGNSNPEGDNFSLAFDALTSPQLEDLQMSIGDSYSYQTPSDSLADSQASVISVNGQQLADTAGGFDDCFVDGQDSDPNLHWDCADGALLSVGGVGDASTNPTLPVADPIGDLPDDELYSLSPFVQVGSTSIEVQTRNASSNDNIFFAAFNLKHIVASVTTGDGSPTLPNTGASASSVALVGAAASVMLVAGLTLVIARRRSLA